MKKRLLFIMLLASTINTFGQQPDSSIRKQPCVFGGQPYFKNGKATVTFKAIYCDIHRSGSLYSHKGFPDDFHKYKVLLHEPIYSGTDIGFIIKGCSNPVSAPLICNCDDVNNIKIGTIIYLRCLVFEEYKGKYFFVVHNVSVNKPLN